MDPTLATDGLLFVQVVDVLASDPHIALACSERTHSTSVKGVDARTSTGADPTWLAGNMWSTIATQVANGQALREVITLPCGGQAA
jgi:hypothetical protein